MKDLKRKGFYFSTRDIVRMAVLIAVSGTFQYIWAHLVFDIQILGSFSAVFTNLGFMMWGYIALLFVPKSGSATIVKGLGAILEVILGNPVGAVAIAYGTLEGIAVDISYVLFKRKLSVNMMIIGALISQFITGPIDVYRDAVPLNFSALSAYFAPGIAGTVLTGWLSFLTIESLKKGAPELAEEKR